MGQSGRRMVGSIEITAAMVDKNVWKNVVEASYLFLELFFHLPVGVQCLPLIVPLTLQSIKCFPRSSVMARLDLL
jgi:hypothetical protein